MQSGELIVIGSDSVSIALPHGKPDRVRVAFKDSAESVPCSPGSPDLLEFDVIDTPAGFMLHISWTVAGVRKVSWEVDY
jgi:hypothetical protein